MESGLYQGWVRHRRRRPVEHVFELPLFMVYLDLGELSDVFRGRWLWSTNRPALAWFRRGDHLGDPELPLDRCVRDLVQERTGRRPSGPVRLLTHLRYLGYAINPVSFYYCFDAAGRDVEAIVAEVTNTPWGERHCYVLTPSAPRQRNLTIQRTTPKEFHVSPFMGMELDYAWHARAPGRTLCLRIANHEPDGGLLFDAILALERREIRARSLAWALLRYPAMTLQVVAAIYWQALRLYRKGAPFHPHPRKRELPLEMTS